MELQEVQKRDNRYKEPDKIEWIWYIERRLSYKTQIRDKEWAWWIVAEVELGTSTTTSPWSRWHFNDNTIIFGQWWTTSSYYVFPVKWTYMITMEIHTNNLNRKLDYFEMDVIRWGGSTQIWYDGNSKDDYYASTAYQFYSGDKIGLHFQFSWGSDSSNITGLLRFIQF